MGKRGPRAKGEYSDKSEVLSIRISSELHADLVAIAKHSGKTKSREVEHRLRRSFVDDEKISAGFGGRQNYALMKMISSVIEATVERDDRTWGSTGQPRRKTRNFNWLDDPYAFDQAVIAINAVLEAIRPAGDIPQSLDEAFDKYGRTFQGKLNASETLLDIQKADVLPVPSTKVSYHGSNMAKLKADIGDVVDRAVIRGMTAEQARKRAELAKEYAALRRKKIRSNDDDNRMKALRGEIELLPRPRP
jgi:hypothetical protein